MAMAGMREVLVHSENEGKVVTVTTANATVTGKVIRVNPLILEPVGEGMVTVVDFDSVQTVAIHDAGGAEVIEACKPQTEAKFRGIRRL